MLCLKADLTVRIVQTQFAGNRVLAWRLCWDRCYRRRINDWSQGIGYSDLWLLLPLIRHEIWLIKSPWVLKQPQGRWHWHKWEYSRLSVQQIHCIKNESSSFYVIVLSFKNTCEVECMIWKLQIVSIELLSFYTF